MKILLTAYCACKICTAGAGITASGSVPVEGRTIAVPSSIPLHTPVYVTCPALGWNRRRFIAEDRRAKPSQPVADVFVTNHSHAQRLGVHNATLSTK